MTSRIQIGLVDSVVEINRPFEKHHNYPTLLEILLAAGTDTDTETLIAILKHNNDGRTDQVIYNEFYMEDLPRWQRKNSSK